MSEPLTEMQPDNKLQGSNQSSTDMVVGRSARRLPFSGDSKKRKLIALGLLVIVVVVSAVLWQAHEAASRRDLALLGTDKSIAGLSDDYLSLTPDQAATKLKVETGLDLATLAKQELTDKTFKNFNQANKAAQALYAAGKYNQSYVAFKIAAKRVPKNVDFQFYLNYASLADMKGDQKLKTELVNDAKDAIKHDDSLSAARKADEIDKIDQKL